MVLGPKKRVIVHQTPAAGAQSIEGVLMAKGREYVLDLAELQVQDAKPVQFKGRVRIPRENVAFYQVLS